MKSPDVPSSALPKPERFPSPPESFHVVTEKGPGGDARPAPGSDRGQHSAGGPGASRGACERSSGSSDPFLRDWDQMAFLLFKIDYFKSFMYVCFYFKINFSGCNVRRAWDDGGGGHLSGFTPVLGNVRAVGFTRQT